MKLRPIARYVVVFLLMMVAFVAFGCLSCLAPDSTVKHHIDQSAHRGNLAVDYPLAILNREQCKMDNFTDALILNQAYRMSHDSLLSSVLSPTRAAGPMASVDVLRMMTEGHVEGVQPYPRYWHGSTFLTRLLLLLGDYTRIRVILYLASTLLLAAAAIVLYRRAGAPPVVALLVSLVCINMYVMQFSMQFFPVLALALGAIWALCRKGADSQRGYMVFFVVGMLTAYFDLLTAPLLTLGLPLCVLLWIEGENRSFKQMISRVASTTALWGAGYAGAWIFKWAIATLLLPVNVFADALSQARLRTTDMEDFARIDAIPQNFDMLSISLLLSIAIVLVLMVLLAFNRRGLKRAAVFLCVAAMPYLWFLAVANHSYLHYWFTYRIQAVSILSIMMAFLSVVDFSSSRPRLLSRLCPAKRKRAEE